MAVVRRRRGVLEFAGLPLLKANATLRLAFRRLEVDKLVPAWQEIGSSLRSLPEGFQLESFQRLAADPQRLREGDVRLVAWSDSKLPDLTIEPEASQQTFWTLWVVNLRYGELPAPRSDSNTPSDFPVEAPND